MDYAYFISKTNLKILDILNVEDYTIEVDSEFGGKSSVSVARKPNVSEDDNDFVFLKHDNGKIFFKGLIGTFTNNSGESLHKIAVTEIENIFDRKIFVDGENLLATGIEDFIKHEIEKEFSQNTDSFINMSYITVTASTHTPILASVDTDNGIYNFKTYLGNAREYYGIFLDFEFEGSDLAIKISKKIQPLFKFDSTVSDVDNYVEDYSVDVLSKLSVKWKIPDTEDDNGNVVVGAETDLCYYLKTNRTITTNGSDADRAKGSLDCLYLEKETQDEIAEDVTNQFKSNSYEHSVTADVRIGSNIYPEDQFFIAHECTIKTVSHGVKSSIVTKITRKKNSKYLSVKFGNLPVTLIEKLLRKEKKH